jgi:glycerol-3-phosphate dehydrogenase
MPHDPSMRPVWMVRIGLFLYDHLAKREWLPASGTVDLRSHATGAPLKPATPAASSTATAGSTMPAWWC